MLCLLFLRAATQDIAMFELGHFECCKLAMDDFSFYERLFEMWRGMICDVVMGDLIETSFSTPAMLHLFFADVVSSIYECCDETFCLLL